MVTISFFLCVSNKLQALTGWTPVCFLSDTVCQSGLVPVVVQWNFSDMTLHFCEPQTGSTSTSLSFSHPFLAARAFPARMREARHEQIRWNKSGTVSTAVKKKGSNCIWWPRKALCESKHNNDSSCLKASLNPSQRHTAFCLSTGNYHDEAAEAEATKNGQTFGSADGNWDCSTFGQKALNHVGADSQKLCCISEPWMRRLSESQHAMAEASAWNCRHTWPWSK